MIVVTRGGAPAAGRSIQFSRAGDSTQPGDANMPSLSRFIILLASVSAFGHGLIVVLANCPQPGQPQIVVSITQDQFSKAGRHGLGRPETQKSSRLAGVLAELKLRH